MMTGLTLGGMSCAATFTVVSDTAGFGGSAAAAGADCAADLPLDVRKYLTDGHALRDHGHFGCHRLG